LTGRKVHAPIGILGEWARANGWLTGVGARKWMIDWSRSAQMDDWFEWVRANGWLIGVGMQMDDLLEWARANGLLMGVGVRQCDCGRMVKLLGNTYWFSILCPDGIVQGMFRKCVVVSIAGCWLKTRLSRIFFYRHPGRQAGTACLHPLPGYTETRWALNAVFSSAREMYELSQKHTWFWLQSDRLRCLQMSVPRSRGRTRGHHTQKGGGCVGPCWPKWIGRFSYLFL